MKKQHFEIVWLGDRGTPLTVIHHDYGYRHEVERRTRDFVMDGGRVGSTRVHVTGFVLTPKAEERLQISTV